MIFHLLTEKEHWRKKRAENMRAARALRKHFTVPEYAPYQEMEINGKVIVLEDGFRQRNRTYHPDHPMVSLAVRHWVDRARRCHAIVMDREPVIPNFICIDQQRGT